MCARMRRGKNAGISFEEFLWQRMSRQQPRAGHLNARGEATINVPPSRWWAHAKSTFHGA